MEGAAAGRHAWLGWLGRVLSSSYDTKPHLPGAAASQCNQCCLPQCKLRRQPTLVAAAGSAAVVVAVGGLGDHIRLCKDSA